MTGPTLPANPDVTPPPVAAGAAGAAETAAGAPPPAAATVAAAGAPGGRGRRRKVAFLVILASLLGVFLLFTGWYLTTRKPVTELPVLPPISVADLPSYQSSVYNVSAPTGVAVDAAGDRVYAAESGGDRVVKIFDGKGTQIGTIKPPATTGPDHVPVYVAVDPTNGDVYVTDRPAGALYVYDRDGVYRHTFDPGPDLKGWQPLGVGFDAKGTLYVTDVSAPYHRVHVFSTGGTLIRTIGEQGTFNFPNGVAVDANGLIYVTDSNDGRLIVFTPDGKQRAVVARGPRDGDLGLPRGVAIDDQGHVFVVDTTAHVVQVYKVLGPEDRSPAFIGRFGVQGTSDGSFEFPNGVAVDTRGRIYVTDVANGRVQVWTY
jgi:tripartite motif-containing protein 71